MVELVEVESAFFEVLVEVHHFGEVFGSFSFFVRSGEGDVVELFAGDVVGVLGDFFSAFYSAVEGGIDFLSFFSFEAEFFVAVIVVVVFVFVDVFRFVCAIILLGFNFSDDAVVFDE